MRETLRIVGNDLGFRERIDTNGSVELGWVGSDSFLGSESEDTEQKDAIVRLVYSSLTFFVKAK